MTLSQLFSSYGWQLAIIGLLGTLLVGWLKTPVRNLITKNGKASASDENFDTIAFVFGFIVAVVLGFVYTLVASWAGWIVFADDAPVVYDFALYISNIVGVWLYQISYYQIWKKLGVKRIFEVIVSRIKGKADKNGDGEIDISDALELIQSLLVSGRLGVKDILDVVVKFAPEISKDAISAIEAEAGEDGVVNVSKNVSSLSVIAEELVQKIPQEKLAKVASSLTVLAAAKLEEATKNPAPIRPTVKF